MLDVRNAISKVLDRYTLADIGEITLRKLRRDGLTSPFLSRAMGLPSELRMLPADPNAKPMTAMAFGSSVRPALGTWSYRASHLVIASEQDR